MVYGKAGDVMFLSRIKKDWSRDKSFRSMIVRLIIRGI